VRLICRVCHRELLRPESRAIGIGPVCAAREGDEQGVLILTPPEPCGPAPERAPTVRDAGEDDATCALWIAWAVQLDLPI